MSESIYELEFNLLDGQIVRLSEYVGKLLLIVNTASECGFTPQYAGLQSLWQDYKDQGLMVIGFPCNQFGGQEPGSESTIAAFCQRNYGVTFPLAAKVEVNGDNAHPLFKYLTQAAPGVLKTRTIKWNFTKFLVSKDGASIERFAPTTSPNELRAVIESWLAR